MAKKKSDAERKIAKLQADLKEMEPYSGDYWVAQSMRNTQSELWEQSKKQMKNNMRGMTWNDTRRIAKIFKKKYPDTDVSKLTNSNLFFKMGNAGMLDGLPKIDEDVCAPYLSEIIKILSEDIKDA